MQTALTYTTIDGRILDLAELSEEERAFFARCYAAYRGGASWLEFSKLVERTDNPLLRATDGRITQEVWEHPLFQAVRDLESRLGMAEALAGSG